jgi:tetratricopeptide (TPR) repeat protein
MSLGASIPGPLNDPQMRYYRGADYGLKGDQDRAIIDHDQAIKLEPDYAAAYSDRGVAYGLKRDYEHAIADFDEALKIDPELVLAFFSRGVTYKSMGDKEKAIADFLRVLDLSTDFGQRKLAEDNLIGLGVE